MEVAASIFFVYKIRIFGAPLFPYYKTNGSHVTVYNPDYYGSLYLNDMSEYCPNKQD